MLSFVSLTAERPTEVVRTDNRPVSWSFWSAMLKLAGAVSLLVAGRTHVRQRDACRSVLDRQADPVRRTR
jgi:hypothetical protein